MTNAAWSPRSQFITCTQPYSNYIVVIGGTTAASTNVADIWQNSDGLGQTWTQTTTTVPWGSSVLAGSCVFLYNSALIPNTTYSSAFSTLMVFPHTGYYYRSPDGGVTWLKIPNPYTPSISQSL